MDTLEGSIIQIADHGLVTDANMYDDKEAAKWAV